MTKKPTVRDGERQRSSAVGDPEDRPIDCPGPQGANARWRFLLDQASRLDQCIEGTDLQADFGSLMDLCLGSFKDFSDVRCIKDAAKRWEKLSVVRALEMMEALIHFRREEAVAGEDSGAGFDRGRLIAMNASLCLFGTTNRWEDIIDALAKDGPATAREDGQGVRREAAEALHTLGQPTSRTILKYVAEVREEFQDTPRRPPVR